MKKSGLMFLFFAGACVVAGAACAQGREIYTWKDKNGVVHYSDTAPDDPKAESMEAPEAYFPGSADAYPDRPAADIPGADKPSSGQASSGAGAENEEISYAEQKRREIARNREERRAAQAERDRKCAAAREQVAALEPHRRVFFTNDQGETERMDDEVRVGKVEEAKAEIAKYCD
jgi:hypothetical protein